MATAAYAVRAAHDNIETAVHEGSSTGCSMQAAFAELQPSTRSDAAIDTTSYVSTTLQDHLQALRHVSPNIVFIVRGVGKLGFGVAGILDRHFSKFGGVSRVMVTHSKVKPDRGSSGRAPRVRAGSIGFVVMAQARAVEAILAKEEHVIEGVRVRVEQFVHQQPPVESQAKPQPSTNGVHWQNPSGGTGAADQDLLRIGDDTFLLEKLKESLNNHTARPEDPEQLELPVVMAEMAKLLAASYAQTEAKEVLNYGRQPWERGVSSSSWGPSASDVGSVGRSPATGISDAAGLLEQWQLHQFQQFQKSQQLKQLLQLQQLQRIRQMQQLQELDRLQRQMPLAMQHSLQLLLQQKHLQEELPRQLQLEQLHRQLAEQGPPLLPQVSAEALYQELQGMLLLQQQQDLLQQQQQQQDQQQQHLQLHSYQQAQHAHAQQQAQHSPQHSQQQQPNWPVKQALHQAMQQQQQQQQAQQQLASQSQLARQQQQAQDLQTSALQQQEQQKQIRMLEMQMQQLKLQLQQRPQDASLDSTLLQDFVQLVENLTQQASGHSRGASSVEQLSANFGSVRARPQVEERFTKPELPEQRTGSPKPQRISGSSRDASQWPSLGQHLTQLKDEDSRRVFIVRKIGPMASTRRSS